MQEHEEQVDPSSERQQSLSYAYCETVPLIYIKKDPVLLKIFRGYEKSSVSTKELHFLINNNEVREIIKRQKAVKECTPNSFTPGVIFVCAWHDRDQDVNYMIENTPYCKNTIRYYVDLIYAFKNKAISTTDYSLDRLESIAYFAGKGGNFNVIEALCSERPDLLKFALEGASERTDTYIYKRLRKRCLSNKDMVAQLEGTSSYVIFGLIGFAFGLSTQLFF